MATIHANGTSDALERLEMLVGLHGFSSDLRSVRRFIVSAVDIVVQTMRGAGGRRTVSSVVEIVGLEAVSLCSARSLSRPGTSRTEGHGAIMALLTGIIAFFCLTVAGLLIIHMTGARLRLADLHRLEILLADPREGAAMTGATSERWLPFFLEHKLVRAGWEPSRRQIIAGAVGLLLAVAAAMTAAGPLAGLLTAATLVLLGLAMLEYRAGVRVRLLSDCMLGFLERMRQLLSVGNSLSVALERAVENSPAIVAQCLAPTLRRIANGSGVAESIERCAADMDLYELHLLATAARTNLRFGGSMTAILRNIIENIRRRASVERELRANTTQIRASAWVLALLPVLVATLVMLTNRDYSRWFLATEKGHHMIVYAVLSQFAGVWCMRMITRSRY